MSIGKQTLWVMLVHGGIALGVVIAATVLGFHGSLDGEAVTAIYGAALGFAGGASSAVGAVNGKAQVSDQTLRAAIQSPAHPQAQGPELDTAA